MMLLQLSSAQGPDECCLAVKKALDRLIAEANLLRVRLTLVETEPGGRPGTLRSALVSLDGDGAQALSDRWCGTVLWICQSPYRPNHRRKNWYMGVGRFVADAREDADTIRFETLRASGPGGQHARLCPLTVRERRRHARLRDTA
jgi:peptide chain release factor